MRAYFDLDIEVGWISRLHKVLVELQPSLAVARAGLDQGSLVLVGLLLGSVLQQDSLVLVISHIALHSLDVAVHADRVDLWVIFVACGTFVHLLLDLPIDLLHGET